ncbi:hypothetical protein Pmar_PMAR021168, partial [Perkinsus marinus ATCC 50983]
MTLHAIDGKKFFMPEYRDGATPGDKPLHYRCRLCRGSPKKFKFKNVTRFSEHIEQEHYRDLGLPPPSKAKAKRTSVTPSTPCVLAASEDDVGEHTPLHGLAKYFAPVPPPSIVAPFHKSLVRFCMTHGIPLELVVGEEFKDCLNTLRKPYA